MTSSRCQVILPPPPPETGFEPPRPPWQLLAWSIGLGLYIIAVWALRLLP